MYIHMNFSSRRIIEYPNPTNMPTAHYVPRRGSKNCPPCLPPWGGGIIVTNDDNDDDASADGGHDNYNDATRGGTKKLRTTIVAGSGGDAPRLMDSETRTVPNRVTSRARHRVVSRKEDGKSCIDGIPFVDALVDVPPRPLILKNAKRVYDDNTRRRPVKAGSSKYTGVYRDKSIGKWKAQIMVHGRVRSIGYYDNEEDAAGDYAKAAFKYKVLSTRSVDDTYGGLDLSNIPEQPLITNNSIPSGYQGVRRRKSGKWEARISSDKKRFILGYSDTPEEAASIYARAAFCLERMKSEVNKA